MPQTPERPLTPSQVAALFSVTVTTVGKWADEGKLPYFRTPGGQRRFHPQEIERIRRSGGIDSPEAVA